MKCPSYEANLNGKRCCQQCLPGFGVVLPCSYENNTVCEACIHGESFSGNHSHLAVCQPCRSCPKNTHLVRTCNVTHDTECECDRNYYLDQRKERCVLCDGCPVGHGAIRMCSSHQNTRCRRCPNGTFSDQPNGQGCRVCRVCGPNQIILQRCSSSQNTVCIDLPTIRSTPTSYHHLGDIEAKKSHDSTGHSQKDIIPLYCALLGALVAGLLIYVIIKNWKQKAANQRNKKNLLAYSATAPPGIVTAPPGVGVQVKQGSDSGVYVELDTRPMTGSMRVRDIPSTKLKILESCLYSSREDDTCWRRLGRELGYSTSRIASFEVRAQQDGHTPVRYLIIDWSKNPNAIVTILLRALRNIGRDDIVRILQSEPRDYPSQQRLPQLV